MAVLNLIFKVIDSLWFLNIFKSSFDGVMSLNDELYGKISL